MFFILSQGHRDAHLFSHISFCTSFLSLAVIYFGCRIEIHFNINHTVDNEETEAGLDPSMDKPEFGELKSKPTFDVDIKRGTTTLSFTCSFFGAQPEAQSEEGFSKCFV